MVNRTSNPLGVSACTVFSETKNELQLMFRLRLLAPLGRFVVPFWRPLDFEGVPKSTHFRTNQNKIRKMRSKKEAWKNIILRLNFDAKMGGLKLYKKMFSYSICCNLRDLGGHENWMKMEVQMAPQSHQNWSIGHPRCDLLRFWLISASLFLLMFLVLAKGVPKS